MIQCKLMLGLGQKIIKAYIGAQVSGGACILKYSKTSFLKELKDSEDLMIGGSEFQIVPI